MRDVSPIVLAASQAAGGGESNNFLVPNGTFFFVLAIFLIVLAVIGTWVVPPVLKVLRERDAMVHKTQEDSKKAADQFAAAQADYEEAMKEARVQASSYRDNARAEGRKVVEDARAHAEQQSGGQRGKRILVPGKGIRAVTRRCARSGPTAGPGRPSGWKAWASWSAGSRTTSTTCST